MDLILNCTLVDNKESLWRHLINRRNINYSWFGQKIIYGSYGGKGRLLGTTGALAVLYKCSVACVDT